MSNSKAACGHELPPVGTLDQSFLRAWMEACKCSSCYRAVQKPFLVYAIKDSLAGTVCPELFYSLDEATEVCTRLKARYKGLIGSNFRVVEYTVR